MRAARGFTLLELMITIAIVGVLATLSYGGFEHLREKSNFRTMQEFGVELALNQQLHRQRYGSYAQRVTSAGTSSSTNMVMPTSDKYTVKVSGADFRGYTAQVTPSTNWPTRLPEECSVLVVESDRGLQRFGAKSATNAPTSDKCIPHG